MIIFYTIIFTLHFNVINFFVLYFFNENINCNVSFIAIFIYERIKNNNQYRIKTVYCGGIVTDSSFLFFSPVAASSLKGQRLKF